jgi:hypothetical protein
MSEFRVDQITNQSGTAGPQIAGITTFTSSSGMVMPSGTTEYRGGRGRGIFGGGYTPTNLNTIDYITISTAGNALDFGDLYTTVRRNGSNSSSTRGIWAGGRTPSDYTNVIQYITISSTGNSFYFGDLTIVRWSTGGCSSPTRGLWGGGYGSPSIASPSNTNAIDYVTIASLGNSSRFGDLSISRRETAAFSSPTRGVWGGGKTPATTNTIDYVTIASLGNAVDFGDMTISAGERAGCSNSVRGLFGGGTNVIDYVTIASTGDAIDFGDLLTLGYQFLAACSSPLRGIFAGGGDAPATILNSIEFVTIATTGNATDFGDLTVARICLEGLSDAHGGLGD